jgi:hypothetical protein
MLAFSVPQERIFDVWLLARRLNERSQLIIGLMINWLDRAKPRG